MLPALNILPQHGSVSISTIQNVFLVGSGRKIAPDTLSPLDAFDTVLGTSPEVLNKAIHHYSNQDALEGLVELSRRVADLASDGTNPTLRLLSPLRYRSIFALGSSGAFSQEGDAGAYPAFVHARWKELDLSTDATESAGLRCEIDLSQSTAELEVQRSGLKIALQLQSDTPDTVGYELTLSEDHVKAFLKASLRHYTGALAPRGKTIREDRLFIAANLIYHQQYGGGDQSLPRLPIPECARLVPEIEKNADPDLVDAILAVRTTNPEAPRQDLLRLSVNDTGIYTLVLNRSLGQHGLWPLKSNVLMLGATIMRPPGFYPHFLDLMGIIF